VELLITIAFLGREQVKETGSGQATETSFKKKKNFRERVEQVKTGLRCQKRGIFGRSQSSSRKMKPKFHATEPASLLTVA
jgi:hypothetical protein